MEPIKTVRVAAHIHIFLFILCVYSGGVHVRARAVCNFNVEYENGTARAPGAKTGVMVIEEDDSPGCSRSHTTRPMAGQNAKTPKPKRQGKKYRTKLFNVIIIFYINNRSNSCTNRKTLGWHTRTPVLMAANLSLSLISQKKRRQRGKINLYF